MPRSRLFLKVLLAEIAVVFVVMGIFKSIEDRMIAGMTAGVVFVGLGAFILSLGLRAVEFRRTATFVFGCIHLFAMSLPMLLTRLMTAGEEFKNVSVLGMSGPVFHRVSTSIYLFMMAATVIDLVRSWRRERK